MSTATIQAESVHKKQRITKVWLVISQVLAFILLILPALLVIGFVIMNLETVSEFMSFDSGEVFVALAVAGLLLLGPLIVIPSAVFAWRSFAKEQYRRASIVTSIPLLFFVLGQCVLPMFFPLLITIGDSLFNPPDNSPNPIAIDLQERARTSDIRDEFTEIGISELKSNTDSHVDEKIILTGDLFVIRGEDTFLMSSFSTDPVAAGTVIIRTRHLSHELPDVFDEYSGPGPEASIPLTVYGVGREDETIRNAIYEEVTMPSIEAIIIEVGP